MYLKNEQQLQLYEKYVVSQASQAEAAHATSAINGLPAAAAAECQAPLQLQPPKPDQGITQAHGPGGAGATRVCKKCKKNIQDSVPDVFLTSFAHSGAPSPAWTMALCDALISVVRQWQQYLQDQRFAAVQYPAQILS